MKFYVISDNTDTQMGMRLAGIEGVVVHEREEVMEALSEVMQNAEVGIVLITNKLMRLCPDVIYEHKLHSKHPLIVEIPDRHGGTHIADQLQQYVSEAVGIKFYHEWGGGMEKLIGGSPSNGREKLQQFGAIIGQEVAQRCQEIEDELEEHRKLELENEEDSVLLDSYHFIRQEVDEIGTETTKAVSKSRVQMRQKLYAGREEYGRALFSQARLRLCAFVRTPEYKGFLLGKVTAIAEAYGCDGFELWVRPEDLALEPELTKAFGYACTVQASERIEIGGVIARHPQKGYLADESLDYILQSQTEWLYGRSELIVTL